MGREVDRIESTSSPVSRREEDVLNIRDGESEGEGERVSQAGFQEVSSGTWCNGSTRDFGSLCSGSNPDVPTKYKFFRGAMLLPQSPSERGSDERLRRERIRCESHSRREGVVIRTPSKVGREKFAVKHDCDADYRKIKISGTNWCKSSDPSTDPERD